MNLINVLKSSALFLGLGDVFDLLGTFSANSTLAETFDAKATSALNQEELIAKSLFNFACSACYEIVADYFPLEKTEQINSVNENEVATSSFSRTVRKICSVRSISGVKIKHRFFADAVRMEVKLPKYEFQYQYYPVSPTSIAGDLEIPAGVPEYLIAYKICCDYCVANSMFEEAQIWEDKFLACTKREMMRKQKNIYDHI